MRLFRLLGPIMLGAVVLGACSSGNGGSTTTTTTAASSGGSTSTSTTTPTTAPTTTSTSAVTTTTAPAQNLIATSAVKTALTAAYVAHNGLPADQVEGTAPGSVYYGYLSSTGTYWAIAGFVPTSTSSQQTQVAMQDDGCCGVFTQTAGGAWTFVTGFLGEPCPGQIPAVLETLWQLQYPGDCPTSTTTTS